MGILPSSSKSDRTLSIFPCPSLIDKMPISYKEH